MISRSARLIALAIIEHNGTILVEEGFDQVKQQAFYRPLGGGIEFREYGYQAVARELMEEIGAEISPPHYLGTIENIFTYQGQTAHELVLLYQADFLDDNFYHQTEIPVYETEQVSTARWIPLTEFLAGKYPLYPDGLLELLQNRPPV